MKTLIKENQLSSSQTQEKFLRKEFSHKPSGVRVSIMDDTNNPVSNKTGFPISRE